MRIKRIWTRICLLAIMIAASSIIGTRTVFADGWSGENTSGGSHTDSGNCSKNGDWDSCGAGFIRMDVNDPNPTRLISNWTGSGYEGTKAYITNTVVPACKKVGASEFYLLVLHVFQGGKPTGTFGLTRKVGDIIAGGGYKGAQGWMGTRYRSGSNALAFSEVLGIYEYARFTYAPAHSEQEWGDFLTKPWSNVTAFCWNPKWKTEEAETSFGAFSIVVSDEVNNGSRNSTYPTQDSKKTWEITSNEDKVRVTFAHKFFYYGGNKLSSNTTEQASTNWEVMVTRDGKGYYEPDHVGAIDGITFQGTYSVPGYNKNASFSGSDGSGCPGNICNEDVGINTYDIDISNLKLGESTVVCSEISYDPKAFLWRSENGNPFKIIKRTNANKSSTGCVKITRGAGENVEFWSNSSAEIVSDGMSDTSDNDGTVNVSAHRDAKNEDGATVRFWHNLHYTGNIPDNLDKDICTNFDFSYQSSPNISSNRVETIKDDDPNKSGNQYCVSKHSPTSKDSSKSALGDRNEAIGLSYDIRIDNLQPGENKICQTINYNPKYFTVLQDPKNNISTTDDGSGRGSSTACVIIVKEEGVKPPETDLPDETPFYTGEQDDLTFEDIEVQSNYNKVLLEAVSYYYQVPVNVDASPNPAEGISETDQDPQSWFSSRSNAQQFTKVESISDNRSYYLPNDHSPVVTPSDKLNLTLKGKKVDIVVPDTVGDKICKGVAYHWEERTVKSQKHIHYCPPRGGRCTEDYIYSYPDPDTLKNYWQIEGSTCEPILKKPTTNIWNGSLSTQAGIKTTVANRYSHRSDPNYTIRSVSENYLSEKNKFGSWSEYLAVARGTVSNKPFGFGSGASLSYKGTDPNSDLINNSPLTIANNDSSNIGGASITPSSTYASRLKTYIYSNDALKNDPSSKVNVVECGSECNITSNVALDYNANSINDIPQTIYHATGDINISSNVSRIDAWLISDNGKVNTCVNFNSPSTPAKVQAYAPTSNAECSQQLIINGPVIASGVVLNRTAGSDPLTYTDTSKLGSGTDPRSIPGEVFNLSADTYLWAYAQASRSNSSYTEAYSRELPPRY